MNNSRVKSRQSLAGVYDPEDSAKPYKLFQFEMLRDLSENAYIKWGMRLIALLILACALTAMVFSILTYNNSQDILHQTHSDMEKILKILKHS
jgi:hypothetical protein